MSYDISFKVRVHNTDMYVPVGKCHANITWNVREIITRSTGLAWINEENNGSCSTVIPIIEEGYKKLCSDPKKYKKYESPNGYGTVEGVIHFFECILEAWKDFQIWYLPLVPYATFWIE